MSEIVYKVPYIKQQGNHDCWAASAAMMLGKSVGPGSATLSVPHADGARGLPSSDDNILQFAASHNFKILSLRSDAQSLTLQRLTGLLRDGPLWVGGTFRVNRPDGTFETRGHAYVIAGVKENNVLVLDPQLGQRWVDYNQLMREQPLRLMILLQKPRLTAPISSMSVTPQLDRKTSDAVANSVSAYPFSGALGGTTKSVPRTPDNSHRSTSARGSNVSPSSPAWGRTAKSLGPNLTYGKPSNISANFWPGPPDPTFGHTAIGLPAAADYRKLSTFARGLSANPSSPTSSEMAKGQGSSPNYPRPTSTARNLQAGPASPTFSQTAIGLPAVADYSKLSTFARGLNVNPSSPTLSEMAKGLGSSRNYAGPTGTPVPDRTSLPSGNPHGQEANVKSLPSSYGSPSSIPTWDKLPRNVRDALRGAGFENWYRDPRNTEAGRLTLLNLYSKMQSKDLWRMVQGPAQPLSNKGPTAGSIQLRFKDFGGLRRNLFDRDDFTNPTWSTSSWSANWESRSKDSAAQLHLKNWSGNVVEAHIDPVGFVWRRPWSFIPHVQDMAGYTNVTKIGEILRSQGHASWAAGASSGGSVARGKMLAQPQGSVSRLTTGSAGGTARGIDASLSDAGVARKTQNLPTGPSHAKVSAMSQGLYSSTHSPAIRQTPKELGSSPNYPRPSNMARNLHAVPTSSTFSQTAIGLPTSPNYGRLSTFARGLYANPSSPTLGPMAKGLGPSSSHARPSNMPGGLKTSSFSGSSNKEWGFLPVPPVYGNSISMSGGPHPGISNQSLSKTAGAGLRTSTLSSSPSSIPSPSNAFTLPGNQSSTGSSLNSNSSSGGLSSLPGSSGTPSPSNRPGGTANGSRTSSFSGSSTGQGSGPGKFNPAAVKNMARPPATTATPGSQSSQRMVVTPATATGGTGGGAFGGVAANLSRGSAAAH